MDRKLNLNREALELKNNKVWSNLCNDLLEKIEKAKNSLNYSRDIRENPLKITELQEDIRCFEYILKYPDRFLKEENE